MENPFFKEGDTLVYVVWYDDNEPYEDNYQCIDAIFSSWDEAENYLNNKQLIKKENDWKWIYSADISAHIKEPYWEYEGHEGDYYPTYTIEIWNTVTGKQVLYDNEHIFLIEVK